MITAQRAAQLLREQDRGGEFRTASLQEIEWLQSQVDMKKFFSIYKVLKHYAYLEPERTPPITPMLNPVFKPTKTQIDSSHHIGLMNLLCVIHRDGGQYIHNHGIEKAIADATERIINQNALLDVSAISVESSETAHPQE